MELDAHYMVDTMGIVLIIRNLPREGVQGGIEGNGVEEKRYVGQGVKIMPNEPDTVITMV